MPLTQLSRAEKLAIAFVFVWFFVGGIGHFVATDFFVSIVPPSLPMRYEAVYVSGVFELLGAAGLLITRLRRWAGWGLFLLTLAVTPANVYMWLNPELFATIPSFLLSIRLVIQVGLLYTIWWGVCRQQKAL